MKHSDHIKSHDLDLIASKVQYWWDECERGYRDADGDIEVAGIDPLASMEAIGNADLAKVASDVRDRATSPIF